MPKAEKEEVKKEEIPMEEMPLETLRDYRLYNERARKINKKHRKLLYPLKQCPEELHPHQRIVFNRNDQPTNPLPVYISNHLIEFKKTLIPGEVYDLPECVIHHLSTRGYPVWDWVEGKNGARETKVVSTTPRFALRTVYSEV